MMKIGDTIKCNDMSDMWQKKVLLERMGIYTDPEFPLSDFTLKVWKIKEIGDDNFSNDIR